MSAQRTVVVLTADVFTSTAFSGNPCAVLPDAQGLSDEEMQAIAKEMNLSETVFVLPSDAGGFRLRFFTPRCELPYAGHPTIAAVFLLAQLGRIYPRLPVTQLEVACGVGVRTVDVLYDGDAPDRVVLHQGHVVFGQTAPRPAVAESLKVDEDDLFADAVPRVAGVGVPFLMIPLADRDVLLAASPSWQRLRDACSAVDVSAAYAFAPGASRAGIDLCARFFDPFNRYEDPFTGSACGAMAAFARLIGSASGRKLAVEQGESLGRPGTAEVHVDESGGIHVAGKAVRILEGTLSLPTRS
jgi:trans-2,3-dihydro-3-hydroxyanthranilate isomerase